MINIIQHQVKSSIEYLASNHLIKIENIKVLIVSDTIDLYQNILVALDVHLENISTMDISNFDFFIDESLVDNSFDLIIGNPPNTRQEKIRELKPIVKEYKSFAMTADLNVYYFEKAFYLLKENAILSFFTSSKYTTAKYAEAFRVFLLENINIVEYIDFIESSIGTLKKSKILNSRFDYCKVEKQGVELEAYIAKHQFEYLQNDLDKNRFVFLSLKVLTVKTKIEEHHLESINEDSSKYIIAVNQSRTLGFYKALILDKNRLKMLPIPKISKEAQKPFEILVDYILFAKENNMNVEASLFEWVIDGLVYDLYFEEEMKKGDCFISAEVAKIIEPCDNSKEKIKEMYKIFKANKTVQGGLIYSRIIGVVKIINGANK